MIFVRQIKNLFIAFVRNDFESNSSASENKLIIAVDGRTLEEVEPILQCIKDEYKGEIENILIKFNDLHFRIGADGINSLMEKFPDFQIMDDPKLHDIGPTVEHCFKQLAESGLGNQTKYITIHASGGKEMIQAAVKERNKQNIDTKILAVTVLTTLGEAGAQALFDETAKHGVLKFAKMALENGADGIVCSPLEAPILRAVFGEKYGNFLIVTPGIRFADSKADHQTRKKTPSGGIIGGSTDLVMGTDILVKNEDGTINHQKMINAINRFSKEIDGIVYEAEKEKYENERVRYTGSVLERLKYAGAIYEAPEGGTLCRLRNGRYSNGYLNIGAMERYYGNLEDFSSDIAEKLEKELGWDQVKADEIDEIRSEYVVLGAQIGSIRLSGVLAEKMGIEMSIYTEKYSVDEQKFDDIKKLKILHDSKSISESNFGLKVLEIINNNDYKDKMVLKRHDIDLKGKKVILSEDMITKGTTLAKMKKIVEDRGGEVVAVACVGNRHGKNDYEGIPLISCETINSFKEYWDEDTLIQFINDMKENGKSDSEIEAEIERIKREEIPVPEGVKIETNPKANWSELIKSMG